MPCSPSASRQFQREGPDAADGIAGHQDARGSASFIAVTLQLHQRRRTLFLNVAEFVERLR